MHVVGYIILALGVISLFGNMTGAGGANDPDPSGVNKRAGCWLVVIALGAILAFW